MNVVCLDQDALEAGDELRFVFSDGENLVNVDVMVIDEPSRNGIHRVLQVTGEERVLNLLEADRTRDTTTPYRGAPVLLPDISGRYSYGQELRTGFSGESHHTSREGLKLIEIQAITRESQTLTAPDGVAEMAAVVFS